MASCWSKVVGGAITGLFLFLMFGASNVRAQEEDMDSPAAVNTQADDQKDDRNKGASSLPPGEELVNIDFPEPTDVRDIIKAVAVWTNKNVILDKNVSGKVQIISPRKVTKEEAYQAFLSALNLVGLTTVETGKVIKIMPVRRAVKGNLKTFLGSSWTPRTDEVITQIVPLKYIDARSIQRTLSRIVSPNSIIAYPATNTLIISDSGYKVQRILKIIELLDVQGQQPKVAIVPIKYGDAKSIASKVQEIFKGSSRVSSKSRTTSGGFLTYKIIVDERTNSVIIFGPPRTISDVKELVRKFDTRIEDPSSQASIHVRPLEYADAKKLAATLSALASGSRNNTQSTFRRTPRRIARNGRASADNAPPAVAELNGNVKITDDESSNSLIITGSRSAYKVINAIIRKLDMRRSQVFVEADILDMGISNLFNSDFSVLAGAKNNILGAWQAGGLIPLLAAQATQGTSGPSATALQGAAQAFGSDFTVGVLSGKKINIPGIGDITPGVMVRLVKADGNTKVLSSPHILTANNEEAMITVGDKVFFRAEETNPTSGVVSAKTEKIDVDLKLEIKPNVSHSNYVTLNVKVESNSFTVNPTFNLPQVNKRQTSQIVTVKNGQTVVISGLVKSTEMESYRKIPLLGDIPILGWLFRNTSKESVKTNLMIFLTPHIVHGAEDLAAIYQNKLKERDAFLKLINGESYRERDFYTQLPKTEDGVYRPDPMDEAEKKRFEQMREDLHKDIGLTSGGSLESGDEEQPDRETVIMPVPQGMVDPDDGGGFSPGSVPPPPPPSESLDVDNDDFGSPGVGDDNG